ncbi:MAG TPA: ABC transporter permease [bacterium]|nr:ABC transporter permease [bacterium]
MLATLVQNELVKIFSKWRSYIGFLAIAALIPLVLWGISKTGPAFERDVTRSLSGGLMVVGSVLNGFLATYLIMNFLWVHIPFLIALVAGDVIAGEGTSGTFRIYLIRPVSRTRIVIAKLFATFLYTILLIGFFALMSLGLGSIWLGTGDLVVFHQGVLVLPEHMVWGRFILAFLFAAGAMCVVAALCFMFSSMVTNAIGPIIGAMSVIIIGLAISTIPIDWFANIRPYIFTTYFDIWQMVFYDPIPWDQIGKSLLVLGLYAAGFMGVSYTIFVRKDILS